jgi:hypothetical protein
MTGLIDELKRENSLIFETLKDIKKLGVRTKEGQAKLLSARAGLLAHLKREDEEVYPALKMSAEKDESLKRIMNLFEDDMKEVSSLANSFFEKYPQGGAGIEFITDFGQLFMALKVRIALEENVIFTEYVNGQTSCC